MDAECAFATLLLVLADINVCVLLQSHNETVGEGKQTSFFSVHVNGLLLCVLLQSHKETVGNGKQTSFFSVHVDGPLLCVLLQSHNETVGKGKQTPFFSVHVNGPLPNFRGKIRSWPPKKQQPIKTTTKTTGSLRYSTP